ncbi:FxLYD domain-containing protein [Clostridium novyi]
MKNNKSAIIIIIASICLILGMNYFNKNYRFTCFNKEETVQKESTEDLNNHLLGAVTSHNLQLCESVLSRGANPNELLSDGDYILYKALLSGNEDICDCLIKHGADVSMIQIHPNTIYEDKAIKLFKKYNVKGNLTTLDDVFPTKNDTTTVKDNKINNFEILEHHGGEYITGKVKNVSGRDYSSVYIKINILDMKGNVINSTIDDISNLRNGQIWSFKAPCLTEGQYRYEITGIDAY